MTTNVFSKVIEAVQINPIRVNQRKVAMPVQLNGSFEQRNMLIQATKGEFYVGEKYVKLNEGDLYFVPVGQPIYIKFGKGGNHAIFDRQTFQSGEEREKYLVSVAPKEDTSKISDMYVITMFDVQIYNIISLFTLLGMPGFVVPADADFSDILKKMMKEEEENKVGKHKMLTAYTEQLVVKIFRHIESMPEFGRYREKLDYLLDKRLVNIIKYIHDNLGTDLSNKMIAEIACVSEDYVGQFFKNLTNINLQEYIETQRLEKAHYLLRTRADIVQEIAQRVGFKDPAYFSRRFKMKFGVNANLVRRKDAISI